MASGAPPKIKCSMCNCVNYPDCSFKEEFCENCIDGGCGGHLKLDGKGNGMRDIMENSEKCKHCENYYQEEELKDEICEGCQAYFLAHSCDKCGDLYGNCMCYQQDCENCKT